MIFLIRNCVAFLIKKRSTRDAQLAEGNLNFVPTCVRKSRKRLFDPRQFVLKRHKVALIAEQNLNFARSFFAINASEWRINMNTTLEEIISDDTNNDLNILTTMNLDNSFDYTNDYYINSFDYILDIEEVPRHNSSEGCHVVSSGDSITIVHENGKDKHISNPPYECASDKYEAKKNAKKVANTNVSTKKSLNTTKPRTTDSLKKTTKPSQMSSIDKAKLEAKKAELKAKLEQKATDSIYTEPYKHSNSDVARQTVSTSTVNTSNTYTINRKAQNSHDEVFGNNNTTQNNNSGAFVKLFIILFIFFPIVSSIFTSCVATLSAVFD